MNALPHFGHVGVRSSRKRRAARSSMRSGVSGNTLVTATTCTCGANFGLGASFALGAIFVLGFRRGPWGIADALYRRAVLPYAR